VSRRAEAGRGPRTIAFVHRGHDWIRGSEQCLLDLVARLDRSRFRPVVICEQPTLAREAAALGAPVVKLDPADEWSVTLAREARPRIRATVRDALREHGAALVHSNVTAVLPVILPVVRRLRLPTIAHLHLPVNEEHQRLREFVHQADVCVGVSAFMLDPLRADGVPASRLRVIYNGVDTDRLGRGDAAGLREALGVPAGAVVAVAVGSLIHRKAHDVTLRGLADARRRGADVRLLVCGDGEEDAALRSLAADLGVAPFVHFLGYRADVGAVVRDAGDLGVTSAREETLGLNVLEAQWLGVPVVASDIPAHREALAAGVSGVLVPPEDHAALGRTLAELAAAPARRAALGAAGPGVVAERFAMSQYVDHFQALYDELLARPRSAYGWVSGVKWPPVYTAWVTRVARRRLGFASRPPRAAAAQSA
jgi:hypothetical protein